ncbi:unnamed protein product [Heterobilharzia americana]|nr:unnamed protein product [Heterobilharzia americana]
MSTEEAKPVNCGDMINLEEKVKLALEENVSLKSYIERMNSECMELNAALFEEANKMVNEALAKQHYAAKQLKEKTQENEILHSELRALKKLVGELSSNMVYQVKKNSFSPSKLKYNNIACDKSPEVYRKLATSHILDARQSSYKSSGLEQFSRRDLLTAMLTNHACRNHLDFDAFQEFLEWIQDDCSLNLPNTVFIELNEQLCTNAKNENDVKEINTEKGDDIQKSGLLNDSYNPNESNYLSVPKNEVCTDLSNSCAFNNTVDHSKEDVMKNKNTFSQTSPVSTRTQPKIKIINVKRTIPVDQKDKDHEYSSLNASLIHKDGNIVEKNTDGDNNSKAGGNLQHLPIPSVSPHSSVCVSHSSDSNCQLNTKLNFIHRLYIQDIKPCFEFSSPSLLLSIYRALPELALEIIPIAQELSGSLHGSNDNTNNNGIMTTQVTRGRCVLLPKYEAEFSMRIRASDSDELDCNISSQARDRIVAVVNLFQYLSIIKRGLANSPLSGENGKTQQFDQINEDNNANENEAINVQYQQNGSSNLHLNGSKRTISIKAEVREQQFRAIQRHRLNITLARLGYGAPDLE